MTRKQERIMSLPNAFAPLPSYVKKAIGNLKVTGIAAESIAKACEQNRIKYESPGIVGDSAIHFVFPQLKAGLLLKAKENTSQSFRHKVFKCRKIGWDIMIVTTEDIEVLPQDTITTHLKEFVETVKARRNAKEIG
jgi:hypothetical protein